MIPSPALVLYQYCVYDNEAFELRIVQESPAWRYQIEKSDPDVIKMVWICNTVV
jgi:hypothetical protein